MPKVKAEGVAAAAAAAGPAAAAEPAAAAAAAGVAAAAASAGPLVFQVACTLAVTLSCASFDVAPNSMKRVSLGFMTISRDVALSFDMVWELSLPKSLSGL